MTVKAIRGGVRNTLGLALLWLAVHTGSAHGQVAPYRYFYSFAGPQQDAAAPGQQLANPRGIATGPEGTVFVASDSRIVAFTPDGDFLRMWGDRGTEDGRFRGLDDLDIGPDGLVYAADSCNERVHKYTAEGTLVQSWKVDFLDGETCWRLALAASPSGSVYVGYYGSNEIQEYSRSGALVNRWLLEGRLGVRALEAASDGTLYVVTDYVVDHVAADGTPLGTWNLLPDYQVRQVSQAQDGSFYLGGVGVSDAIHPFKWPVVLHVASDGTTTDE